MDDIAKTSDKISTFGPSKCTGCTWSCFGIKIGGKMNWKWHCVLFREFLLPQTCILRLPWLDIDIAFFGTCQLLSNKIHVMQIIDLSLVRLVRSFNFIKLIITLIRLHERNFILQLLQPTLFLISSRYKKSEFFSWTVSFIKINLHYIVCLRRTYRKWLCHRYLKKIIVQRYLY